MGYWIFKAFFLFIFKVFFRLKVEGRENLPKKSNFIVVCRHVSFLDAPLLMGAFPVKGHFIVADFLYNIPFIRWFLKVVEAIPIGKSSEIAVSLLLENKVVGMFPEGGVSRNGNLGEFRRGASLLAYKTGRPILPCAILGTDEALPLGAKFPKFVPIKLKIGKPVYVPKEFGDWIDDVYLQEVTLKLRKIIQELIDAG
jgi:1-acyl-sn-glycerol-3-phosphate acyltransferase